MQDNLKVCRIPTVSASQIPGNPVPPRTQNLELEGVRGMAALLVALGHVLSLNVLAPTTTLSPWLRQIEAAHASVLIFFVLSGYLIGWTNAVSFSGQACRAYATRRMRRLAPIYYASIVLTIVVTIARHEPGQIRSLLGAITGLQNFNDYFGFHFSVPIINGPLWSLHYELLYYVLFILIWRFQPDLFWVFVPALILTVAGWIGAIAVPAIIRGYACGWIFWASGWWLARQPIMGPDSPKSYPATWLLLVIAGHRLRGLTPLLGLLGLHTVDPGMITLGDLGLLPAIILLIASITRRQIPAEGIVIATAWLLAVIPLIATLLQNELVVTPACFVAGACILLSGGLSRYHGTGIFKKFSWLGGISYAFYVVHYPLLFVVRVLPVPGNNISSYFIRVLIWAATAVALAWILEKRFQPWVLSRYRNQRLFR